MRRSKFTEDQIAFALKQSELGTSVEEAYSRMGISDPRRTFTLSGISLKTVG